jgi:hypothetical protein
VAISWYGVAACQGREAFETADLRILAKIWVLHPDRFSGKSTQEPSEENSWV